MGQEYLWNHTVYRSTVFSEKCLPLLKAPLNNSVANYTFAAGPDCWNRGRSSSSFLSSSALVCRFRKTVGVFCTVVGLYVIFGSLTTVEATNVDWVYDLEQGLELAREQNKPVMVDFYADWCTVCKEIEAFTYTDDAVDEQLDRFVNIKVDIDRVDNREQIIERYQITGLPLIVFYDSLGRCFWRRELPDLSTRELRSACGGYQVIQVKVFSSSMRVFMDLDIYRCFPVNHSFSVVMYKEKRRFLRKFINVSVEEMMKRLLLLVSFMEWC